MKFPVVQDVAERVATTFVLTVAGLATADGVNWTDWGSLDNWRTWAIGGVTAGFSLVKSVAALRIGRKSASLAPSVGLQPVSGD